MEKVVKDKIKLILLAIFIFIGVLLINEIINPLSTEERFSLSDERRIEYENIIRNNPECSKENQYMAFHLFVTYSSKTQDENATKYWKQYLEHCRGFKK